MATLRPFRDYDEKDVINLFTMDLAAGTNADGAISLGSDWSGRLSHGHVVSLSNGWNKGLELHEMLGDAGAGSAGLSNVTTQRYGITAKMRSAGGALHPLGLTLYHVAAYDENGEQLKFNPHKASELEACIVGQAVPVVTRGIFLVNGVDVSNQGDGSAVAMDAAWLAAGGALYSGANGSITTGVNDGTNALIKIGKALGLAHTDGDVLMRLEL
jgi:hypothetical protein